MGPIRQVTKQFIMNGEDDNVFFLVAVQVFNMKPLQVVLPSREDQERPAVDLDLHLAFLCFRPEQLLQVSSAWPGGA